jgi:hypothetical protein
MLISVRTHTLSFCYMFRLCTHQSTGSRRIKRRIKNMPPKQPVYVIVGIGVAQSAHCLRYGLDDPDSESRQGQQIYLHSISSRPALGPHVVLFNTKRQPFLRSYRGWSVISRPHTPSLVPRVTIRWATHPVWLHWLLLTPGSYCTYTKHVLCDIVLRSVSRGTCNWSLLHITIIM